MTKNIFKSWFYDDYDRAEIKKMNIRDASVMALYDIIEKFEDCYYEIGKELFDSGYSCFEAAVNDDDLTDWMQCTVIDFAYMYLEFLEIPENSITISNYFDFNDPEIKELERKQKNIINEINYYIEDLEYQREYEMKK